MRGRIIKLVLLAAVSVVMLQGATAWASSVSAPIGQSFGSMVVDDANQHVFVSSPADDAVLVYNFSGSLVATIPNIDGAYGMVIHGSTLYVTESTGGMIEAIGVATLNDEGSVGIGLVDPQVLAFAAGELWTATEPDEGYTELTSVSLSGQVTVLPASASTQYSRPNFATSPATPNILYVGNSSGFLYDLYELDVSTGSPVVVAGGSGGDVGLAVSPDGTRLIPAGSGSDMEELSASTLVSDGVAYPGGTAVAVSPGNGGLVATGPAGFALPNVSVFQAGATTPIFTTSIDNWGGNSSVVPGGLALSADGTKLFAVEKTQGTDGGGPFRLGTFALDSPGTTTSTTLTSAQLSSGNSYGLSLTATVAPSDGDGSVAFYLYGSDVPISGCGSVPLTETSPGETATCNATSLPRGSTVAFAYYSGDASYTTSFGWADVNVAGGDYTWSGDSSGDVDVGEDVYGWDSATNWVGVASPSDSVGTLTFPTLTSSACTQGTPDYACYTAYADVSGLTASGVVVDSDTAYNFDGIGQPFGGGAGFSVGAGGLTVESPDGNGHPPTFESPITLSTPQTWAIDEGPVSFTGSIAGNQNLTLDLDSGAIEPTSAEVGDITATGEGSIYLDGNDRVDSLDGNSVDVGNGAGIESDRTGNAVGPLTVGSDGWLSVGGNDSGAGSLSVQGDLTFQNGSELDLPVDMPGTIAGTDYPQITSTGNVSLSGGELDLAQGADSSGNCDDLRTGDVLTLISTTGTITGTFSNYANGVAVDIENDCDYSPQDATGTLSYSAHAVTLTITNGGDAAEFADGPVEVNPPSISGSPVVGQTLQLDPGTWEEATSYEYSWYACGPDTCDQIPGATGLTFQVTAAQLGDQIAAIVDVNGPGGTNGDYTDLTDTVTTTPVPVPGMSTAPAITGTATVGSILSTTTGTWTNSPSSYAYQWERCSSTGTSCAAISGATAATYTLTSTDAGSTIEVVTTGTNSLGAGSPAASKPTAVVSAATTPPPTSTLRSTTTPPVSAATVKSDLQGVLKPTGKTASLQSVLAHHSYAFSFHAPARGKLTVTWVATIKHRTVTLAKASVTISGARKVNVPVRLTGSGTSDLKRYPHLKIKAEVRFTAAGLKPVNESASFTLSERKTAHASAGLTRSPKELPRSAFHPSNLTDRSRT
jgi:hypothetical protein